MKKLVLILILCGFSLLAAQDYKLIESKTNREITLQEMAELALQYDVTFFGELHDNALLHHLEIGLLQDMHNLYPDLIVSLEMFERDVQPEVDAYLAGKMNEDEFILASRAWNNYHSDYKPIVDFCKNQHLTLLAANIPRRLAALIAQGGESVLDSLSTEDRKLAARRYHIYDDEYKTRFFRTIEGNMTMMPDNPMGKKSMENLYIAQCLKDDTMAESILKYQHIPPRKKVLHFNGDFHSRKHLGTAQKLQMIEPMLHIAVITPIVSNQNLEYTQEDLPEGDFLIVIKGNPEE
ncbi:MAG TPA: ChaN family lipoprotein [Candidatus Cloacimonadota bacterium]|nr:ChaN family lipoprotein [Candidatus Cloacimonadota bacterium]